MRYIEFAALMPALPLAGEEDHPAGRAGGGGTPSAHGSLLTRRFVSATALGLCVAVLALPSPTVAAVPPFDGKAETLLVGPRVVPRASDQRGAWTVRRGGLAGGEVWIADGNGASLDQGQVRARFEARGGVLDLGLYLDLALIPGKSIIKNGIGLRIEKRYAWIENYGTNGEKQSGDRVLLKRMRSGARSLEIVLSRLGGILVAGVFEEPSGRALGTLTALSPEGAPSGSGSGEAAVRGRVGVFLGRMQRRALTLLSTRPACQGLPRPRATGPYLVVTIKADQASKVDASTAVRLDEVPGPPAATLFRGNVVGLERMVCQGLSLLEVSTRLPFQYLDLTYLQRRDRDPEATADGFDLRAAYVNPRQVERLLRGFNQRHPDRTQLRVLGKSHHGQPILALGISADRAGMGNRPSLLLMGAHHGEEVLTVMQVLDAIQYLLERGKADPRVDGWLNQTTLWCMPLVNPDGLATFLHRNSQLGRKNGRGLDENDPKTFEEGVDLNRNYPFRWGQGGAKASSPSARSRYFRGPTAGSEPEAQAVMTLANRERFVAALSFHTGTVAILAPYTIDGVKSPEPNEAWTVAEDVASSRDRYAQMRPFSVRRKLYSVDGTDQDWLRHSHGTVALLVEEAPYSPRGAADRQRAIEAVRPVWMALIERFLDGPSLSGVVTDEAGRPLNAEVSIVEQRLFEGERWTTRPTDGSFHRFLPAPGRYTVQVTLPDGQRRRKTVDVGRGRARLKVTIKPRAED